MLLIVGGELCGLFPGSGRIDSTVDQDATDVRWIRGLAAACATADPQEAICVHRVGLRFGGVKAVCPNAGRHVVSLDHPLIRLASAQPPVRSLTGRTVWLIRGIARRRAYGLLAPGLQSGSSTPPAAFAERAAMKSRSESRFRYMRASGLTSAASEASSARRATVRATCSRAAASLRPGRTKLFSSG